VQVSDGVGIPEPRGTGYTKRVDRSPPGASRDIAEIHPSVGAGLDHLVRVGTVDIIDGLIPREEPFWSDHVMGDICETCAAAVRNAPDNLRAITVTTYVARLVNTYEEVFDLCRARNIQIVVALPVTYRRITLENFRRWENGEIL